MPEVILVHGLWYGRVSTALLKRRLQAAGFTVTTFTYASIFRNPAEAAARLEKRLPQSKGKTTHLVGHSLGGLIILKALSLHGRPVKGRIVMLGSPLNGSRVARRIAAWPILRRLLGYSSRLLRNGTELSSGQVVIGMIAGTAGRGLGQVTGAINGPSDGTVLLAETRHPILTGHLEVPVGHTGLLFDRQVSDQVIYFLIHGQFSGK